MAEVRLVDVTKKFGDVVAVDNITLNAIDKEFLVLVGPSGCGKTTSLRMIAGLEEATEGEIFIGKQKVNHVPPKDRDIAMVFQNYALYPHMNVYKNMAFGLKLRKYPKAEVDRLVTEGAKALGIEDLLARKPKELSGGQRQRVAMGRAIVRSPQVFLLDEPLSNLDAKLRVQMRAELARLHERLEKTTIYVTHDQTEAMTLAHRIVVMDRGLIMQVGDPIDVYNNPKNLFVAGFIGSPAMNIFDVRVTGENGTLFVQNDNFKLKIPESLFKRYGKAKSQEAILGIRPEHIYDKNIIGSIPGGEPLEVNIDVFEPIGREVILTTTCGSTLITACVDSQTEARPHSTLELLIDMNRMHLFDKSTHDVY